MSLNHDVHNTPKEETYLNGIIEDFTDCVDFTKQYQITCYGSSGVEPAYQCSASPTTDKETEPIVESDVDRIKPAISELSEDDINLKISDVKIEPKKDEHTETIASPAQQNVKGPENDQHPMEPDVSITVGESNLEKTINHVAKGIDDSGNDLNDIKNLTKSVIHLNGNNVIKVAKKKSVVNRRNHLKLPGNKSIKKKVSVLNKLKNGKFVRKNKQLQQSQYQQGNIKFKCYKCSLTDFSSLSELQTHQRKCISQELQTLGDPTSFTPPSPSSNFRYPRKVYFCSVCGTYFESWNLFLHMKEMHKRHICLYCLGMFSQPDRLAHHLLTKHNVSEQTLNSSEEFFKLYRGTSYLICCSCEKMFSEQDEFYEHSCISSSLTEETGACPLCGLQGAHFPTCRRAFSDRYVDQESYKSHPALGKKNSNKKKKVKANKKPKEVFRIVNNENSGDMSVIVRKQTAADICDSTETRREPSYFGTQKEPADSTVLSPLRTSADELVSMKQFNEKMLQLYRPNRPPEKITSSIQSIEDSINRVVENSAMEYEEEKHVDEEEEEEEEDDTNFQEPIDYDMNESKEEDENKASAMAVPPPFSEPIPEVENSTINEEESYDQPSANELSYDKDDKEEENVSKNYDHCALSDNDSSDSEKLTIALEQPNDRQEENEAEPEPELDPEPEQSETSYEQQCDKIDDGIPTAGPETPFICVTIKEGNNDEPKAMMREFIKATCWNCVYCAHAKRIAVNGKQIILHILAEHRFIIVPEDSTDEEKLESASKIVQKLKDNISNLENCYFNTDTFDSEDKGFWKANDRIYECFHCCFATYVHKELYSHNRKMHQKAGFLCIMCKSNFYNYSELLCHLCPGIYIPGQVINPDITYRCFLCDIDPLPSSFRLMVHLRRRHNSCDICFDLSSNQLQLSTHVWKHKLSHMCYRCGIAYRNKPDITKHLFWKHGTESVLCKKCLQKKWPHVYHFCVPPPSFSCDECALTFKSAVTLKVHKRIHSSEFPYSCEKCEDRFVSRKLLARHLEKHEEEENKPPVEPEVAEEEPPPVEENNHVEEEREEAKPDAEVHSSDVEKKQEKERKTKKRKVLADVFDLPPVNLSESDDSDEEDANSQPKVILEEETPAGNEDEPISNGYLNGDMKDDTPADQIVDGVWNNFQNYLVSKDPNSRFRCLSPFKNMTMSRIKEIMLSDHDYYIPATNVTHVAQDPYSEKTEIERTEEKKRAGLDHDYCNNVPKPKPGKNKQKNSKHKEDGSKSSSSESSSDSDSSCTCGSNCSCSSASSSSSSSNDSESEDEKEDKERKKKERKKIVRDEKVATEVEAEPLPDVDITVHDVSAENAIRESDLETDETETDEDFYDYNPAREANRILAEKRTQLLANLNGIEASVSSPSTPTPVEKPPAAKKKSKLKKKRSQPRASNSFTKTNRKKNAVSNPLDLYSIPSTFSNEVNCDPNSNTNYDVTPMQPCTRLIDEEAFHSSGESDTKRPKRKRVPLKFYGFSSDDESDVVQTSRKKEKLEVNTTTPAPVVSYPPAPEPVVETTPTIWNPSSKSSLSWRVEKSDSAATPKVNPIKIRTSQTVRQDVPFGSANSEVFHIRRPQLGTFQVNGNSTGTSAPPPPATGQKGEKLYCFCQCPYDEVSEMIACDAEDCVIEWFHFECVGIMVPPKGSWYCPDCRKKLAAENEFMPAPLNEQNMN